MFYISEVKVQGFWSKYNVDVNFHKDVNIFIGKNGSGKTTFMNILHAVLNVDIRLFSNLEFSNIRIKMLNSKNKTRRTISVFRQPDNEANALIYKIGNNIFTIPIYSNELELRRIMRPKSIIKRDIDIVKAKIAKIVDISSLSVYRENIDIFDDDFPKLQRVIKSSIDSRLDGLIQQLTAYQLTLAKETENISSQFQKDVLLSILYDENFDKIDNNSNLMLNQLDSSELARVYKSFELSNHYTVMKIHKHVEILLSSIKKFQDNMINNEPILVNDIFPLSLLKRTSHIISLSTDAEERKNKIFNPINKFIKILRDFIDDKDININTAGEIIIKKDDKVISIFDLSSGEKQLLILLTETLLQKEKFFIFIADEPELSLHIEWQSKIIPSIRQINPNSQVIVATHSPEIAGGWKNKIIDMGDIING